MGKKLGLKEQLFECNKIYLKHAPNHYVFRDHYFKIFDEFAIKNNYKTHENYSTTVFTKEVRSSLNVGLNTGHIAIETLENVNATHFKNKMGIYARIIRNVEWVNLNLSDNCIDAISFAANYRKRAPKLKGKKRTQYIHEIISFHKSTTPEGLHEYLNWMNKINFEEESFSSNKNLYYQNNMLIYMVYDLQKDIKEIKRGLLELNLKLKSILQRDDVV